MWLVVLGNVVDGLRFYGPFPTEQAAWDWDHDDTAYPTEDSADQVDFKVVELRTP